jgi:ADP-ribose pyrophosphatase YjhB (NUDIX family)
MPSRPPLIVLGVVRRPDDSLLLTASADPATGQPFYRPIGGHVEFGETATVTLVREFGEELGLDVAVSSYLGTLENLFTYNNQPGHEVDLVFAAALTDAALYDEPRFPRLDDPPDARRHAVWVPVADLLSGSIPLYPTGLLALLTDPSAPSFLSAASNNGVR